MLVVWCMCGTVHVVCYMRREMRKDAAPHRISVAFTDVVGIFSIFIVRRADFRRLQTLSVPVPFKVISKRTGFDRALEFNNMDCGCRLAENM